jgi:hypothetical protein
MPTKNGEIVLGEVTQISKAISTEEKGLQINPLHR